MPDARLRARRPPERLPGVALAVVARVVEVADEPALVDARSTTISSTATRDRRRLAQPRELGREERHLRPAVADDHDARRLLGDSARGR